MKLEFVKSVPTAVLPSMANADDAGFDLSSVEAVTILPGQTKIIDTGIAVAIPRGNVGMVCPRSGLAAKNNVTVLNAPGIIDSGYRGNIKVILTNQSETDVFEVKVGMRIAQLVIVPLALDIELVEVTSLDTTERGTGGLGSSGQ